MAALSQYYLGVEKGADRVTNTIRCPSLPLHIKCGVNEVASAFKKFLASVPGGILGSLGLFDAMAAIHSQLHGDPEFTRTKQSKVRARLVALAIGTVKSQYRRDLICAVFGLLCMVGRAAETAPREDEFGRPLPTADLMGYNALGIVFGPLLIGDLIEGHSMKLATPDSGLQLFPLTPTKLRKERQKRMATLEEKSTIALTVDKMHAANNITEMIITHWRDVVKHLKSLEVLKSKKDRAVADNRS